MIRKQAHRESNTLYNIFVSCLIASFLLVWSFIMVKTFISFIKLAPTRRFAAFAPLNWYLLSFRYDYRAGFWGVMGHACLGIIPPFIEEFNYPMQKNCGAGNTGILVNGRELNDKDLTLLASRGLPVTQGRSYIIEISGKVWDEETGEELDCLGKLAPTLKK